MKIVKKFWQNNNGILLIFLLLLIPLFWWLWSITLDGTDAKYVSARAKTALNRAVKAAVLAVDKEMLAQGSIVIDSNTARANFDRVFTVNLGLREDYTPAVASPIQEAPEILDYYVCQRPYPYTYNFWLEGVKNITYTFNDPGVFALIKVRYKHNFTGKMQEIYIYAAAEVISD